MMKQTKKKEGFEAQKSFAADKKVLANIAVVNSCNIILCLIMQDYRKKVNECEWVKILRKDLVAAYGSVQVFSALCPATFASLETFGWNSFL